MRFTVCHGTFDLRLSNGGSAGSHYEVRAIELWHGYSQGDYSQAFSWNLSEVTLPTPLKDDSEIRIPISFDARSFEFNSRLHVAVNPQYPGDFGEFHFVYLAPSGTGCIAPE